MTFVEMWERDTKVMNKLQTYDNLLGPALFFFLILAHPVYKCE